MDVICEVISGLAIAFVVGFGIGFIIGSDSDIKGIRIDRDSVYMEVNGKKLEFIRAMDGKYYKVDKEAK